MSLIQEVKLQLDDASRERLAAAMRKAGHQIDEAMAQELGKMSGPAAARLAARMEKSLKDGTDPEVPKKNLSAIGSTLERIGKAIVATFAVQRIIAFGKSLFVAAIEAEAPWARLDQSLSGIGIRLDGVRGQVDKLVASLSNTRFDDEAIANTLGTLVQMTGDYTKSLGAVAVVADLAAAKHLDLDTATMLVGKAMNGNTELLQRYGIFVQKGADGLEALRRQFAGFAAGEGKAMVGQVEILGNAWSDAKEGLGGFLIEAGDGISIIQALTQSLRWLNAELAVQSQPARIAKEMRLGEVEDKLKWHKGKSDSYSMFDDQGFMSTWGKERPKLLAEQIALTRELNTAAKEHYATLIATAKASEEAAKKAKLAREQLTDAEQKAAKEKAELAQRVAAEKVWNVEKDLDRMPTWAISAADKAAFGNTTAAGPGFTTPKSPWAGTSAATPELQASIAANVAAALRGIADDPPPMLTEGWADVWASVAGSAAQIGDALLDSWGGAIEQMKKDAFTLGDLFQGLGNSIAKSLIQGVGAFARTKVLENVASAIEEGAKSLSAFAKGNAVGGVLHLQAAGKHVAASVAWSALGGAANSATMGSTSRGGIGSGYATGVNTKDSLESERRGATINITIDGIDPSNPRHGDLVIATMGAASERYGGTVIINGKRSG